MQGPKVPDTGGFIPNSFWLRGSDGLVQGRLLEADSDSQAGSGGRGRSAGLGRTRLFHPWAHEPEGGWSGACVPCRTLSDPVRGQGLMGWVC